MPAPPLHRRAAPSAWRGAAPLPARERRRPKSHPRRSNFAGSPSPAALRPEAASTVRYLTGVPARILLFALDELRARYGALAPVGADPRDDTTPFRAFRAALLDALAPAARAEATLSMWWEGGYNGYALAIAIEPADAVHDAEPLAAVACPVDATRLAPARRDRYPLAHVTPGRWDVGRDEQGATVEAPFGAATGHFGAPGMRRRT